MDTILSVLGFVHGAIFVGAVVMFAYSLPIYRRPEAVSYVVALVRMRSPKATEAECLAALRSRMFVVLMFDSIMRWPSIGLGLLILVNKWRG